jgi:hypothetical protein
MDITRRQLIQGVSIAGAAGVGLNSARTDANVQETETAKVARKRRTIYFNDARHYYLYVLEPPMTLEEAWRPIDEVAGTSVNTFIYGVERGDGLFYPSKVGMRFGADKQPSDFAAYWRVWQNMQSLIDQGFDPLTVLIDRAHDKQMEFFASLRMSSYGGIDQRLTVPGGGRGLAHAEVRDHQFAVLQELATRYRVEGVELDFSAAPGGMPLMLRKEDVAKFTPVMTDYVSKISKMVRRRPGSRGEVGVRVYPTEQMCLNNGLDVRTWMKERIVDYVVPMLYIDFTLDPGMPIEWLVDAAHQSEVPVYGMLQPYVRNVATGAATAQHATPEMMRAAAANYWAQGVDGLYTWFLKWPLGDAERRTLADLGDADLIKEQNKHYVLRRRSKQADELGYHADLPIKVPSADPQKKYSIPFYIADDFEGSQERIRQVQLRININNLVSADQLTVQLNGKSLALENCLRDFGNRNAPYEGHWLEFSLKDDRPRQGQNTLEISLDKRAAGLEGGVSIENVEISVEYGVYPSVLKS